MPAVARKDKKDTVRSPHGTGNECNSPATYHTDKGSGNVFAEGTGVVRSGDAMETHPAPGCSPHSPGLSSYSPNVYANGKKVGRKGDEYSGHKITSGASKVIAN